MPNGVFPVPRFRPTRQGARSEQPSLMLRLRTFCHRDRLDHQLARGVDPAESEMLELRAQQLRGSRRRLAADVEGVVARARRPFAFTAQVPLRPTQVRACSHDLHALAARLRDDAAIDVQGAAMAWTLLRDGSSPLYLDSGPSLRHAVRATRLALDPVALPVEPLTAAA